jgi:hypothetical protein
MNPNQMMIAKAMVARTKAGRSRTTRKDHHFLGLLRRR